MALERDGQESLAVIKLSDLVMPQAGAQSVEGDAVDTLGFRTVSFVLIPDTLDAGDVITFLAQESSDDGVADAYADVPRDYILPTSRQGDDNPVEVMPGVYEQVWGVTSAERYVKPQITAPGTVVAEITFTVFAILEPEKRPFQDNLEADNVYPGDGLP